jgi:uncharacterized glyoxalase superfamily protein PhnB
MRRLVIAVFPARNQTRVCIARAAAAGPQLDKIVSFSVKYFSRRQLLEQAMTETRRQAFIPALSYQDPIAALKWLERAFGFETAMLIMGQSGVYRADEFHAEMRLGDGVIMIGGEWTDQHRSPKSTGGITTQTVHVHLDQDIDAHCARARAAGATIVAEPSEQFYGDRTYRAADPEGHIWSFGQTVRQVSREEAEKASGLKIEGWV